MELNSNGRNTNNQQIAINKRSCGAMLEKCCEEEQRKGTEDNREMLDVMEEEDLSEEAVFEDVKSGTSTFTYLGKSVPDRRTYNYKSSNTEACQL